MKKYINLVKRGCLKYRQFSNNGEQRTVQEIKTWKCSRIRNIAILAHIDAGKTTTTERMLYYSGTIHNMGEVHHGNTVTDYMDQERVRGITITSVAVSFPWNGHQFNLIDTPGHIDFTIEVERTLNVLDGAVVVLDGSAGVEAQTVTVWRQADRYTLPRIVYVNKMDRSDADLEFCLKSIQTKLEVQPLALQIPLYDNKKLCGLINLVTLKKLTWSMETQGKHYNQISLDPNVHDKLWDQSVSSRVRLTEQLADIDDELAEIVIQQESLEHISAEVLINSLQRVTLAQKAVPVLCGSSYKNLGVQPLMDAVVHYLPAPHQRNEMLMNCFGDTLCARAFKVIHDDQKRPITFFRIYTGKFCKGQKIYNIQQERTEQIGKLMSAYADERQEVSEMDCGNIAAVTGLKFTATGDFISANATSANNAKNKLISDGNVKNGEIFGLSAQVPVPVFFCSIEPSSQAYQQPLEQALQELQREDPSLVVTFSADTGQTILAGMGELHLDIIRNRIVTEYKIDAELGPLQIAYRETIKANCKDSHTMQHKIGSLNHQVTITLSVLTNPNAQNKDILEFDRSPESASNIANISLKYLQAIKQGIGAALVHGPKLNSPVVDVSVMLHWFQAARGTSDTIVSAATTQCIQKIVANSGTYLLEPMMNLEIITNKDKLSIILADLSRRRTSIHQISNRGQNKVVLATAPLSNLLGYSTDLRMITSGSANFSMEFNSYQAMTALDEARAIKDVTGFEQCQ